jgi:ferrous iron transport protein A
MADTLLMNLPSHSVPAPVVVARSVAMLKKGDSAVVARLRAAHTPEQASIRTRLLELGFVPGETLRVVAQSILGGAPLAIRLGNSTFALRRHEAELIEILPAA